MCPVLIGPIIVNGMQSSASVNIGPNLFLNIASHSKANRGSGENFGDLVNTPRIISTNADCDVLDHTYEAVQIP